MSDNTIPHTPDNKKKNRKDPNYTFGTPRNLPSSSNPSPEVGRNETMRNNNNSTSHTPSETGSDINSSLYTPTNSTGNRTMDYPGNTFGRNTPESDETMNNPETPQNSPRQNGISCALFQEAARNRVGISDHPPIDYPNVSNVPNIQPQSQPDIQERQNRQHL